MTELPVGTVTFFRTDVEGSMGLARTLGRDWDAVNATHLGLIRSAVDANGGVCVRTEGDAFFGVFPEAGLAVTAAAEAQRALVAHHWPDGASVRVRMGLHSGEAHLAGDDYGGFEVNRAARVSATGHGGQIVMSEPTRTLVEPALAGGMALRDLGRHVLRDLPAPEHLYQLVVPGLPAEFPPLRTTGSGAGNLPARMTSFVGRDAAVAEVGDLSSRNRLVTLTGPGGIGKTSLAVEVARTKAAATPDGAWFVALDTVTDPGQVAPTIARTLGLLDGPERSAADALPGYLAEKSVVLVLDNFEQVLEAAEVVSAILRASPGSHVIVTSRAPLHLAAEQEYPVAPLEVRGEASAGLFVDRARAVRPGFDPGPDTDAVDEICGLLDGLPLGIELAAARISLLPVRAIRDRLAAHLPIPGTGPRDVPARQRTLEGAISWSHDLLGPDERRLLHDLAVFEGGFDLEQASLVAGRDVLDGIGVLVDQSLVTRDTLGSLDAVRFRMLTTIRSFALDRLIEEGREGDLRRRHAEVFLALAEDAAPNLPGPDQSSWLDRLGLDHANFRSAVRWAIDAGEVDLALRLVSALWRFWQMDCHLIEGRESSDAALALPGADAPTSARLAAVAGAGGLAYWTAETEIALGYYQEQLRLAEQLGDLPATADAWNNLSYVRFAGNDKTSALEAANKALDLYTELGDERGVARLEWSRGTLLLQQGHPEQALQIFNASLATFEAKNDTFFGTMATGSIAWCLYAMDRYVEATPWFIRSLVANYGQRDVASTTITLPAAAIMAVVAGRPEDAGLLLGAFEALSDRYGVRPPGGLQVLFSLWDPMDRVRASLTQDRVTETMARGRRMSLAEAVELTLQIGDQLQAQGPA